MLKQVQRVKSRTRNLLFFLSILTILLSITLILYTNTKIIETIYIDYDFKVKEPKHLGFNAGTDALHFGIIAPGTAGLRDLELTTEEKAKVIIKVLDHDFVFPNKNNFILEPNKTTSVQFTVKPPADIPQGNYSGKIRIIFKRP